ncbi:DUF3263 domain-containing protein [Microbispora sp. SCL1-1]|nr:DUF3263 domain-containing protein [Microbispora sp. CL1-1]TQS08222.1 DUF3263 domain-containing protein [Microbispora sp. SCL1-1]
MGRAREPIEEEPMDTEPAGGDGPDLSDRDREMLAFERQWWRYAGAKEQAIREAFGISATRYYQLLGELIDRPEALEHDPMLVKRLRRMRAGRRRDRSARRFGFNS